MKNVALLLPLFLCVALQGAWATTITVENKCTFTVWPAALPGGGKELPSGQSWSFDVAAGTTSARLWGRTGCSFDGSGKGSCKTGDCGGQLQCTGSGAVPATLFEYTLTQNDDTYDMSLVDGFNLAMSIYPSRSGCTTINCNKDINGACPSDLKVQDGCASACVKFGQPQYCCTGSYVDNCPATDYSRFFKGQCPQAYSYAKDDKSSTFTCPTGGNYRVVFCG